MTDEHNPMHGPVGRQTEESSLPFLDRAIRAFLRATPSGGVVAAARNKVTPIPVRNDMLIFRCAQDELDRGGGRDVCRAFAPAAAGFAFHHYAPWSSIVVIDNGSGRSNRSRAQRKRDVLAAINGWTGPPLKCVAMFCHGMPDWLQLGFQGEEVNELADAIAAKAADDVTVPLYACAAGASPEEHARNRPPRAGSDPEQDQAAARRPLPAILGQGSFAFQLRDRLVERGRHRARVDAHFTVAHATQNPDLRRFEGAVGAAGINFFASEDTTVAQHRRRAVRLALRYPIRTASLLIYRFPFMDLTEIALELDRVAALPLPPESVMREEERGQRGRSRQRRAAGGG